jgi:nucleoside-diphosphate-sugar epimerase
MYESTHNGLAWTNVINAARIVNAVRRVIMASTCTIKGMEDFRAQREGERS